MPAPVRGGPGIVAPPVSGGQPQPYSLPWWLARLSARLLERSTAIIQCSDYYDGKQPLRLASEAFTRNFASRFANDPRLPTFCANLMELVVNTHRERLRVEGIRYGDDEDTDTEAWAWWQRHRMDAMSGPAHTEAIICGTAAVTVWPDGDGEPVPTIEHPLQMIVETAPGRWWDRRAALKQYVDDLGYLRAELYLPTSNPARMQAGIYRFVTKRPVAWLASGVVVLPPLDEWTDDAPPFIPNALGIVPVVPVPNSARLARVVSGRLVPDEGGSDIAGLLSSQDAINTYRTDALVAAEFGAFRQRWAIGLDIPTDPETGQPVEPFRVALDRLWVVPPPDPEDPNPPKVEFGEFAVSELAPFLDAIDKEVRHIAVASRTPYHYFLGEQQNIPPSGESLAASETGLVRKVQDSQVIKGESWEEVFRLNFLWRSDPRGRATDSELRWGDAERRSESEHVDALVKLLALGIPQDVLWEMVPLTPKTIARIKAAQATAPAVPPAPPDEQADILARAGVANP